MLWRLVPETILLTGGTGLVGRNLLETPGFAHRQVLHPTRSELDLIDGQAVRDFLRSHRPDTIVHAAGRVGGILANMQNQAGFLETNLRMGLNLCMAAAEEGVSRFVNLASSCVYPPQAESPLRPEALFSGPLEPTNEGYALAKLATLRLGELLSAERDDFRLVSLIPCNLYGRWDHFDPVRSHLIPAILHKLHRAKSERSDEVVIWGDGLARREFMYAGDLARVIVAVLDAFDRCPQRLNVGIGRDWTVNEYYEAAAEVVGWSGTFRHDLDKPTGMRRKLVATTVPAGVDWPAMTSLKEGLRATYRFYREHVADG